LTLRWSDFAVLYRYNALAFIVAIALEERGIPHDFQNAGLLFASRAGQDVIAWLRYVLGKPARGDLTRVLSRPGRILPYARASGLDSREDLLQLIENYAHGDREERLLRQFLESTTRLETLVHALAADEFLEELDRAAGFRAARRRRSVPGGDPDEADDATCFDVIQAMAGSGRTAEDFLARAEEMMNSAPAPAVESTRGSCFLI